MKQTINIGTNPNDGTGDYLRLVGQKLNSMFGEMYSGRANVVDFGATGDGVTDDTAAIQACIDWAYNNNIAEIYVPAGNYKISDDIWLDAPDNARTHWSGPPNAQFTLRLIGAGWGGSEAPGSNFIQTVAGKSGVIVGPGQYMGVYKMNIQGPNVNHRSELTGLAGIHILCAGGGAHGTTIEDCQISNFYNGVRVGGNTDSLGDSNVINCCQISNCMYGFATWGSQQFINTVTNSTIQNCKYGVYSNYNLHIEVFGGNFSTWNSFTAAIAFSAVVGWDYTSFQDTEQENFQNFRFPIHVDDNTTLIADCDIFCIETPKVGFVPLRKHSWNAGTNILELKLDASWCNEVGGSGPALTEALLDDFLTSVIDDTATLLYGGEYIYTFASAGVHARGVHIENYNAVTCVARSTSGWNQGTSIRLEDILINYDPNFGSYAAYDPDTAEYALYALAQVWPVIDVNTDRGIYMDNCNIPALWRFSSTIYTPENRRRLVTSRNSRGSMTGPIIASGRNSLDGDQTDDFGTFAEFGGRGSGHFDRSQQVPWLYYTDWAAGKLAHIDGISQSPYVGHFPAPYTTPRLTPGMLDRLLGTLPTIFTTNFDWSAGGYGPVCGDCIYQVTSHRELDPRSMFVKFKHRGWSWGQNIPTDKISWSHDNPYGFIELTGAATDFLFAGLVVGLDYTGGDIRWCILENERSGMWKVIPLPGQSWKYSAGVPNSGTGLLQETFSVTKIGNLSANALTDSQVNGKRFQVGDIVWQRTPTGGSSMGWICTTAGVAGTDAVFKAMPNLAA